MVFPLLQKKNMGFPPPKAAVSERLVYLRIGEQVRVSCQVIVRLVQGLELTEIVSLSDENYGQKSILWTSVLASRQRREDSVMLKIIVIGGVIIISKYYVISKRVGKQTLKTSRYMSDSIKCFTVP